MTDNKKEKEQAEALESSQRATQHEAKITKESGASPKAPKKAAKK